MPGLSSAHRLVFTGPGTSQVKWPPGLAHGSIYLQIGCHRTPQTLFTLGPSPSHKRPQDLAAPSRGPILAPGPSGSSSQPSDTTIKCTNVCITESQKKGAGDKFEYIIAENFPNLGKEIDIQIQEAQSTPERINPKRPTPRYIVIDMAKKNKY